MEKTTLSYSIKTKGENMYLYLEKKVTDQKKKTAYLGTVDEKDPRVVLIRSREKLKAKLRTMAENDASRVKL